MKTIVLDDDPTGTQSAAGVSVLPDWSGDLTRGALRADDSGYILTNSRAIPPGTVRRYAGARAGFTLLRHRVLLGLRHKPSPPKVRQS